MNDRIVTMLLILLRDIQEKLEKVSAVLKSDNLELFSEQMTEIEIIICMLKGLNHEEYAEDFFEYEMGRLSIDKIYEKLVRKQ